MDMGILISVWIWSLVFDTPIILILALYLDFDLGFWRTLEVPDWDFHPDIDWDMVTGILALSKFEGEKNICVL